MDIVIFVNAWGTRYGGINAFNTSLCIGLAHALNDQATVWCAISDPAPGEAQLIHREYGIQVIPLGNPLTDLSSIIANEFIQNKVGRSVDFWFGHDTITGHIATEAKRRFGGCAVVFHHMAYSLYSSRKRGGMTECKQDILQRKVFQKADLIVAVGPLLHEHSAKFAPDEQRFMIIPGLVEDPQPVSQHPTPFSIFLSGRLDPENDIIKNGRLGVTAFSLAAKKLMGLNTNRLFPVLNLFGLSVDTKQAEKEAADINRLIRSKSGYSLPVNLVPFSENTRHYLCVLAESHVALVLSWHDGFALTAWEAISLAVPLVLSSQTGAFRLLDSLGLAALVHVMTPTGGAASNAKQVADILLAIESNYKESKEKAHTLREILLEKNYTWAGAATELMKFLSGYRPNSLASIAIPGLWSIYGGTERLANGVSLPEAQPAILLLDKFLDGFGSAAPKQQELVVAQFRSAIQTDHQNTGNPQSAYNFLVGGLTQFQREMGKDHPCLAPVHELAGYLLINCDISPSALKKADEHLVNALRLFEKSTVNDGAVNGLVTSSWLYAVSQRLQNLPSVGVGVIDEALHHPLIASLASDAARIKLLRERAVIERSQDDLLYLFHRIEELGANDIEAFHTARRLFEVIMFQQDVKPLAQLSLEVTRLFQKVTQRIDPIYKCIYHRDFFQYNVLIGNKPKAEEHYLLAINMAKQLQLRGQERKLLALHEEWKS